MKSIIKFLLSIIGFILVLAVGAGVWVVNLDPNDHKDWISEKAYEKTGRTLKLDGDINVSVYPWLGIDVGKVTVGNADGFGDKEFFYTDHAKIRVKLLPLLDKKYEVDTVSLSGMVINLARNKEGTGNWEDLVQDEKESEQAIPLAAVVLGGVDIQDARIHWDDQSTEQTATVSDLNIKTNELVYGEPINFTMSFNSVTNKPALKTKTSLASTINYDLENQQYNIKPFDLNSILTSKNIPGGESQLGITAGIDLDLKKDTARVSDINFNALDTSVTGTLSAAKIQSQAPSVQATLDVQGKDMANLFKVAEIEPLASQLATLADRSFKLTTSLDADAERGDVDISQLSANLLGAVIKADIKARNTKSPTPAFQGTIDASGPDLPALLQIAGQFAGKQSALKEYGSKLRKSPEKTFRLKVNFDADMKSGDMKIPTLSADSLGINITGNLNANDMKSKNGSIKGDLSIKGKSITHVLSAVGQEELAKTLKAVNLEVSVNGNTANMDIQPLNLNATFSGKQIPNSPVSVTLKANTNISLDNEKLILKEFLLSGLGLKVNGNVVANKILSTPQFGGQLVVNQFNLRNLLKQLDIKPPATASNEVLQTVSLSTQFAGSAKNVNLKSLNMQLDKSSVTGNLAVSDFNKPATNFNININSINADHYLPPQQQGEKKKPVTPETAAGAVTQLPVEMLRSLNLNGDLAIGEMIISNAKLSKIILKLTADNGKIKLDPAVADLYKGKYSGKINLDVTKNLPRLTINSKLTGVQVEPLLRDVTGEAKIRGTGNFSAALVAAGKDTDTMKKTLNGQMSFNFKNGAIKGFNLGKIMRQGNSLKDTFTLKVSDKEETDLTEISGNPVAKNGVITLDDLSGKSPALRIGGNGVLADLKSNTLNYKVTAHIVATSTGQSGKELEEGKLEGIPLDCYFKGSLDAPKRNCDASKLVAAFAQRLIKGLINLPTKAIPGESTGTAPSTTDDPAKQLKEGLDTLKSIFGN